MHSSATQDFALQQKIRLFNKRLVLAIIAECNRQRVTNMESTDYAWVDRNAIPAQLIAYLESPDANAHTSADAVMKALGNIAPQNAVAQALIAHLYEPIQPGQFPSVAKIERYQELMMEASVSVSQANNLTTTAATTHVFSGADGKKIAASVQTLMAAQHSALSMRGKYEKENLFDQFIAESTPMSLKSYNQVMRAVSYIQDYFTRAFEIDRTISDKETHDAELSALREQLSFDLVGNDPAKPKCGTIGKFFDNSGVIGKKDNTREDKSAITNILTTFRYPLGSADYDAIRGVIEYSKQLSLEMNYDALKKPDVALQLTVIDRDLHVKDYEHLTTRHTDDDIKASVKKAKILKDNDEHPADHYKNIAESYMQEGQIDKNFFAAIIDAGIQITFQNQGGEDLARVLQNTLTLGTRDALMPHVKNYLTKNNIKYSDTEIGQQVDACLQFFHNYMLYAAKVLRTDQTALTLCNNLRGNNSSTGEPNFNEANLAAALDHVKNITCNTMKPFETFFNKMIQESNYTIPNQTHIMQKNNVTAKRPADWFMQGMLLRVGQVMSDVYGSKMQLQLPYEDRILNKVYNNVYDLCRDKRDQNNTTLLKEIEKSNGHAIMTNLIMKKEPGNVSNEYKQVGIDVNAAEKVVTNIKMAAQKTAAQPAPMPTSSALSSSTQAQVTAAIKQATSSAPALSPLRAAPPLPPRAAPLPPTKAAPLPPTKAAPPRPTAMPPGAPSTTTKKPGQ